MTKTLTTVLASLMLAVPFTPSAFADAVGGPRFSSTSVNAFATDRFQPILFVGGRWAEVIIDGDGTTDLDLYVYDSDGNRVAFDDDNLDYCIARWLPPRTGYYTIVVVNRGRVWNAYTMRTN